MHERRQLRVEDVSVIPGLALQDAGDSAHGPLKAMPGAPPMAGLSGVGRFAIASKRVFHRATGKA
jgi:hypothetical protein